jgi:hypothetical protein
LLDDERASGDACDGRHVSSPFLLQRQHLSGVKPDRRRTRPAPLTSWLRASPCGYTQQNASTAESNGCVPHHADHTVGIGSDVCRRPDWRPLRRHDQGRADRRYLDAGPTEFSADAEAPAEVSS